MEKLAKGVKSTVKIKSKSVLSGLKTWGKAKSF